MCRFHTHEDQEAHEVYLRTREYQMKRGIPGTQNVENHYSVDTLDSSWIVVGRGGYRQKNGPRGRHPMGGGMNGGGRKNTLNFSKTKNE